MEPTDLTIEILKNIRDELRGLKEGQLELRDEARITNQRLAGVDERLERHEQALVQLVHQAESTNERLDRHERALGTIIEAIQTLGGRVDNVISGPLGEKVRDLDQRVQAIETHLGL